MWPGFRYGGGIGYPLSGKDKACMTRIIDIGVVSCSAARKVII